jgi:2-isopropylmalate synthase
VPDFFSLVSFRVITERRTDARGMAATLSEATVKLDARGQRFLTVGEGNGPVNALDGALRAALVPMYPALGGMRLVDYKVRILTPEDGTRAVTRVMIESEDDGGPDGTSRHWSTVGVSANVIDASYNALHDAISWKLFRDGVA